MIIFVSTGKLSLMLIWCVKRMYHQIIQAIRAEARQIYMSVKVFSPPLFVSIIPYLSHFRKNLKNKKSPQSIALQGCGGPAGM